MKKKILKVLLCVLAAAALSGCTVSKPETTETTESTEKLERVWKDESNSIYVYVDEKTGVNYLIYNGYYKGGITPRYNADGSPYVTYTK